MGHMSEGALQLNRPVPLDFHSKKLHSAKVTQTSDPFEKSYTTGDPFEILEIVTHDVATRLALCNFPLALRNLKIWIAYVVRVFLLSFVGGDCRFFDVGFFVSHSKQASQTFLEE